MELLNNIMLDWGDLFNLTILLAVIYFSLIFFSQIIKTKNLFGRKQNRVEQTLYYLLLVFEPVAILLLTAVLVLLNPLQLGLLTVIVLITGFQSIKSYILGRIILFDRSIAVGNRLGILDKKGVIAVTGRLGLKLRTNKGLKFINYSTLLTEGYSILSGEQVGSFYELLITSKEENSPIKNTNILLDKLATSPFIDWKNMPDISMTNIESNALKAKITVREAAHLTELKQVMAEWGYHCKISKK